MRYGVEPDIAKSNRPHHGLMRDVVLLDDD